MRSVRYQDSDLVTRIAHVELELPSFKRHQHASEFVPLDAATINDDTWPVRIHFTVPFDSAADGFVDDLQPEIAVSHVGDRKQTTHLFIQLSNKNELIGYWIAYDLKAISDGSSPLVESNASRESLSPN